MARNDAIDILLTQIECLEEDIIECLTKRGVCEEAILDVMELFYTYFKIE